MSLIRIDAGACILSALLLLLLPPNWFLSGIAAALVHETCHIITLIITGGRLLELRFRFSGCEIRAHGAGKWQNIMSILAGPLGSLSLFNLREHCPLIALFGVAHGLYNLLPVLPLDGGRLLRLLLEECGPRISDTVSILCAVCSCVILDGAVFLIFPDTAAVIWAFLWNWQMLKRNIPCKQTQSRVQ